MWSLQFIITWCYLNPKKWAAITSRRFYMYLLLAFITLCQVTYASTINIKNLLGKAASNQNLPVEGIGHLFQSHHLLLPLTQHFPPQLNESKAKKQIIRHFSGKLIWEEEESAPMPTNNEMKCKAALGYDIFLAQKRWVLSTQSLIGHSR